MLSETAIIYCEGHFGEMDGKTANGLIRSSGKYRIVGVIDSTKAGIDTGKYLEGRNNGIPIFPNLIKALEILPEVPDQFIYGIAPSEGHLKKEERNIVIQAIENGMNIVNPLHEFFSEDEEFVGKARQFSTEIFDIRKPPKKKDLHLFSGRILDINTPIIAVLGTDGAVGKRTTAVLLDQALKDRGLHSVLVATGQTGLIQGARYGVAIDAIPSQFITGEIENQIMKAYKHEQPDIILIEGQGALSHPAYISSCGIIRGSRPGAIIVQHPPKRKVLGDFNYLSMPSIEDEIHLLETFSKSQVIAITINHENMSDNEIENTVIEYEAQLQLPTTDVLKHGCSKLITRILELYPELQNKQN